MIPLDEHDDLDEESLAKTISWLVGHFTTNRVRFPGRFHAPDGPEVAAIRELLQAFDVAVVR